MRKKTTRSFWRAWKNVLFPSRTLFWIIYMRRRFCFIFTIMVVELELDTPLFLLFFTGFTI